MSDMRGFESSTQTTDLHQSKAAKQLDSPIRELLQAYEERKARQGTGIFGRSDEDANSESALAATNVQLEPWRQAVRLGVKHDKFSRYGVSFSTLNRVQQDSFVAIGGKVPDDWHAGRILSIFTYTHRGPTPELKYEELTQMDAMHDPYRKHPFIGGRLYYDKVKDPELVTPGEILCHFAHTPFEHPHITSPCIHALPLDRD
ncbi:hypothetical protein EDB85DRAFT_1899220 [Lactarius pseudohatsudake]|nr:hypothetical protein EDB85DRAFT_1899220 [Lactarius pseudohatsudake]